MNNLKTILNAKRKNKKPIHMKIKIYTLAIILLGSITTFSQAPNWSWAQCPLGAYYSNFGQSIASDANGNTYVTGNFTSPTITFGNISLLNPRTDGNGVEMFVAKYDASGNVLWAQCPDGSARIRCQCIALDVNGNSFITGTFSGTATFGAITLTSTIIDNGFVVKYDAAGNVLWAKNVGNVQYPSSIGVSGIGVDANGNSYITGGMNGTFTFGANTLTSNGKYDIFLVKYDGMGNELWVRNAGGTDDDWGTAIKVDASGNSYITGTYSSSGIYFGSVVLNKISGNRDSFFVKYNTSGNVVWANIAGGSGEDTGWGVGIDANGNSYFVGNYISDFTFGSTTLYGTGDNDIYLVKCDALGNFLWGKRAGGFSSDRAQCISTDANGNSYIAGWFASATLTFGNTTLVNSGNSDVFVAKYDASGKSLWAKSAYGNADCWGIANDANGNAYITGRFMSPTITFSSTVLANVGFGNIFVAKLGGITTGIVPDNNPINAVNIFPNPSNGIFNVKSEIEFSKIDIYNMLGEIIYSSSASFGKTNQTEIDLSRQPKGLYFYRLQSDSKVSWAGKVIIE